MTKEMRRPPVFMEQEASFNTFEHVYCLDDYYIEEHEYLAEVRHGTISSQLHSSNKAQTSH